MGQSESKNAMNAPSPTPCNLCYERDKRIRQAKKVAVAVHPSTLDLATMVNLEYYIKMHDSCVHRIAESDSAKIKVKDMVAYLDERMWRVGTQTRYEGFYCTSFINEPARQLVIVHRGTEITNGKQLAADFRIFTNKITPEIVSLAAWHTLQSILNNTMHLDGDNFKSKTNQSVTITGHSLGGWLAQISTLLRQYPGYFGVGATGKVYFGNGLGIDMDQPCRAHCVAFDSPGGEAILTKLRDEDPEWLGGAKRNSKEVAVKLDELDVTIYLANANLVNKCGKHSGNVKRIDVMADASWVNRNLVPAASHSMEGILKYFQDHPLE